MPTSPLTDATALRAAGRSPALPFRIALDDGRELDMLRLLRVLPGKRLVGEALVDGQRVLAKLFIANGSARHWQQECAGIEALRAASVPTPPAVAALALAGGGHVLLTEFLAPAESLDQACSRLATRPPGDTVTTALLLPALAMLGKMHAAGLVQEDLHLGNFLNSKGQLFVIDGDAVRSLTAGKPLTDLQAARNLAILLAQLPAEWDAQRQPLLSAYSAAAGLARPDEELLQREVADVRARRLNDFLAKSVRDCTLFSVKRSFGRFTAAVRSAADSLAPLLAAPDAAMRRGQLLKDGGTCTVTKVAASGRPLVVKRYNLKSTRHAVSRLWRPSRAWHSWREGHRLQFLGIATPAPLALVEERIGPLRRRAWLITEYCPGKNLLEHLAADCAPPDAEAAALTGLFAAMQRMLISHGDLKATNLLWHEERLLLIDLDATTQHRSPAAWQRAWRRDRARLLRNWPQDSALYLWFDAALPPA